MACTSIYKLHSLHLAKLMWSVLKTLLAVFCRTTGAVIASAGSRIITVILPTLHRIAQIVPGLRCELACSFVMTRYCGERSCDLLNGLGGTYSFESGTRSLQVAHIIFSGTCSIEVARIAFRWHMQY